MKQFGEICAVLIALLVSVITNGIVISHLWNWFLPLIGVPSIGFWLAIGISLIVGVFTAIPKSEKEDLSRVLVRGFAVCVGKFMVLGLGTIVRLFV